jgi:hypothetical protein
LAKERNISKEKMQEGKLYAPFLERQYQEFSTQGTVILFL